MDDESRSDGPIIAIGVVLLLIVLGGMAAVGFWAFQRQTALVQAERNAAMAARDQAEAERLRAEQAQAAALQAAAEAERARAEQAGAPEATPGNPMPE